MKAIQPLHPERAFLRILMASMLATAPLLATAELSIPAASIGGGGVSTGGSFSLQSSIGQPAGVTPLSGGPFSLQGSPWNVVVLQSADAPLLNIRLTNGSVRVAWPSPSAGFELQETSELRIAPATTPWVNSPLTVADGGLERFVTFAPGAGVRYFRLNKVP